MEQELSKQKRLANGATRGGNKDATEQEIAQMFQSIHEYHVNAYGHPHDHLMGASDGKEKKKSKAHGHQRSHSSPTRGATTTLDNLERKMNLFKRSPVERKNLENRVCEYAFEIPLVLIPNLPGFFFSPTISAISVDSEIHG